MSILPSVHSWSVPAPIMPTLHIEDPTAAFWVGKRPFPFVEAWSVCFVVANEARKLGLPWQHVSFFFPYIQTGKCCRLLHLSTTTIFACFMGIMGGPETWDQNICSLTDLVCAPVRPWLQES
jgi:hypothetical protein